MKEISLNGTWNYRIGNGAADSQYMPLIDKNRLLGYYFNRIFRNGDENL